MEAKGLEPIVGITQPRLSKEDYSEEYFWEFPREVNSDYMARREEVADNAKKVLARIKTMPDNIYLVSVDSMYLHKIQNPAGFGDIVGCIKKMKNDINNNNYVAMRRMRNVDNIIRSIYDCGRIVEVYLTQNGMEKEILPFELGTGDQISFAF